MFKKIICTTLVLCLLLSSSVFAVENIENDPNKEVLRNLFKYDYSKIGELMDASLLEEICAEDMINTIKLYKSNLGELQDIVSISDGYKLLFEKGYAKAEIVITNENKIIGLFLDNWIIENDSLENILSQFDELSSEVSICIKKNDDKLLFGMNTNKRMSVGSAFKLYVLKALYEAVEKGNASWDDIITLQNENKSIPSGIVQDWPENMPVTVKTLASLMISYSDNTACDHLIDYIGRSKIEKLVTSESKPFLKTNESVRIKYGCDKKVQEQYVKENLYKKRKIIKNAKKDIDLDSLQIKGSPTLINEVGWHFTTEELCSIIFDLKDCEEIKINPGLVEKNKWNIAGFKGGSEPGVLNYTHVLQKDKEDDIYTISVTVNNNEKNVPTNKISELTVRLISLIENGKLN